MILHKLGLILNREAGRGVAPPKTSLPPRLSKERGIKGVRLLHKDQSGFSLIELVIAIAIIGLVTGGITMTIFQVFNVNTLSTNHMIAVRQVQNAGYWVSHDVQMAQIVDTTDNPDGFPLTLTWTDWDPGDVHEVVYTLLEDKKLQRSYSVGGESIGTAIVAEFITTINASGELTLTVTATVGDATETRTYEVTPRPD